MKFTVSQYIARYLREAQVEHVFELSGGMIMHLIDAINREPGLMLVNVYHEQAAAFAADAVGRLTGRPGVALGTSGPGAINLLTGIGSAYFDSSPTVFFTGQVNRHEQKGGRAIRQLGFQETDIVRMAEPITKWAVRVSEASEIPAVIAKAFSVATEGRPGPVLIDIPMDVYRATIEAEAPACAPRSLPAPTESLCQQASGVVAALSCASRPIILAGGGIRAAGAADLFRAFAERSQVPVVTSLLGCDLLASAHPLKVGLIGTYGNRWANLALHESDCVLVLGSRLDIRQTGADTRSFKGDKAIYHVDVEPGEINNRIQGCTGIVAELGSFLEAVLRLEASPEPVPREAWRSRIAALRGEWPDTRELSMAKGINPNAFMHALSRGCPEASYAVDVGLHQMWAAQSLELSQTSRFLTSGGMGAMGFALPAAVGIALSGPRPVAVIAGDAGFQLNIQELQSVVHLRLPIKIVIMNNGCHGMTRQFQDTYFDGRYPGTVWGYSTPDFAAVAAAYGITSRRITDPEEIAEAADWLWQDADRPALLEVMVDQSTNAYPKLAFGMPMSQMEPMAKPMEMEGT